MKKAYLDIETHYIGPYDGQKLFKDYKNHQITVIGIRTITGRNDKFVQLIGNQITKKSILKILTKVDMIITYNGRSIPDRVKGYIGFDFPVITAQLGITLDKKFKHIDLVPLCWRYGYYGGQKKVEKLLDLKRELPDIDGAWANEKWMEYQKTKKERFLKQLLRYNKEDVFMLKRIEEKINSMK